jgi:hypothetical protein
MPEQPKPLRGWVLVNVAILLFGLAGVLGKLVCRDSNSKESPAINRGAMGKQSFVSDSPKPER